MSSEYLVEVKDLKQYFPIRTGFMKTTLLKAVDGVNFSIKPGETLGLVGESGCGKTTVGRTLLRLYKPTGGEIYYDGNLITDQNMIQYRPKMQMVFQDPYSSLDPRMTVEEIIGEPLDVHKLYSNKAERREKILGLMELVGLNAEHATRYVHEFSGGQRQRIGIARALAVDPKFIVCDEAVSALDVSIQAQVINMFEELQEKLGVAYLFIAHDLLVVRHISDRVAVMYLGRVVETADSDELYESPIKELPENHSRGRCAEPAENAFGLCVPHEMPFCDGKVRAGMPSSDGQRKRTYGRLLECMNYRFLQNTGENHRGT